MGRRQNSRRASSNRDRRQPAAGAASNPVPASPASPPRPGESFGSRGQLPEDRAAAPPRDLVWAIGGLLLLMVGLVFGQTIRSEMVNYDDDKYIYENPQVLRGLTAQGTAWC